MINSIILKLCLYIATIQEVKIPVASQVDKLAPRSLSQPASITFLIILYAAILLVGIGLVLYGTNWLLKTWPFFQKLKDSMNNNYFVILIAFPLIYMIYYYAYYLPNLSTSPKSVWMTKEASEMLWTASITFLGTGALTGSLKWLNNLAFFKKQFSELIKSDDFSNVLSEKMKDLALSDDYLLQRNDLAEIWNRVTLCKYQQKFPQIADEIQKKLENDLFIENSLAYYYKNFRMQVNFSLEDDLVKIVEITSFTVISHTTDIIQMHFGTSSPVEDKGQIYTKFIPEACKCDGKNLELKTVRPKDGEVSARSETNFIAELSGQKKYVIERQIEMTQDLKIDRVFDFSSSRIIEDISINLKHDSRINLFFSPVGKNVFNRDNQLRGDHSYSYINRDLLLPGEKFKVFIYKKG